jgi:hypothetical protein
MVPGNAKYYCHIEKQLGSFLYTTQKSYPYISAPKQKTFTHKNLYSNTQNAQKGETTQTSVSTGE